MLSINDIPPSALKVLDHLTEYGPMAPREIAKVSQIPLRTVTFALQKLVKQGLLQKIPNLLDMRKQMYHPHKERITAVEGDIDRLRAITGTHMRIM